MLDSQLLEAFMDRFFGYGNLNAHHWFIGMEEGGGRSEMQVRSRIDRWRELGGGTAVDIAEFHAGVRDDRGSQRHWFENRPKLQRTWRGLIRVLLTTEGATDLSTDAIREVQARRWGRRDSDTCLLELLPLPSPGTLTWLYNQWSDLPYLATRTSYAEQVTARRIAQLRQLISTHSPRSVVFYSTSVEYLDAWSSVSSVPWSDVEAGTIVTAPIGAPLKARFARRGGTHLTVMRHPTATGNTSEYFHGVGRRIRTALEGGR